MLYAGGALAIILTIVGVVFGIVLTVVWTLLPFAVFGIKRRLDEMLAELQTANQVRALEIQERRDNDPSIKSARAAEAVAEFKREHAGG